MINTINFKESGPTNHVWVEFSKADMLTALVNVVGEKIDNEKISDEKYINAIIRKYKDHTSNRKFDPNHVKILQSDMDSGKWASDIDESPVLFRDGKLEGGQHRAIAFLNSVLKTIKFPCVLNQEKWIRSLKVGDYIWDCRYKRRKIISFTKTGSGDKILQMRDGSCSARHCAGKYKWS